LSTEARRIVALTLALAAAALIAAGSGCNIVGAAFVVARGKPKIPPSFVLDENRRTVVLIDDLSNRVPRRSLRDLVGQTVDAELLENGVIAQGSLVSSISARRAAAADSPDDRMSAVDVGRRVGADVVVFVTMTGWTLQREPGTLSPAASMLVRVIDASENQLLWPVGDRAHELVVELPMRGGEIGGPQSQADRRRHDEALARRVGKELGWLFYAHEEESLSQQLRPGPI
jgi:hypothetical protein